ncbi:transcriptional regulator [Candidatus Tenderia electrophaga]|jgi:nitrogen regulatory protein P-II 1|uniref:Transcriptional regulator n=1 Tax=Candidatus Tenderia electrophaga TaxID=1748243 RepID=A0A0S2TEW3_9GAMM|nr:transcriptional regulator [Candidatus Tenderia electrophaga]
MKEIKAFIHRNRITDVIHALKGAGFDNLSIVDVKGTLKALDSKEQDYSVELGTAVITEIKLEVVCEETQVDEAIQLIREHARTGQNDAGWIYVIEIGQAIRIETRAEG